MTIATPDGSAVEGFREATARGLGPRLDSVDLLRGLVMVVMVLDHVRDFFSGAGIDPSDLTMTGPALFFTRWVTHFCAPVFAFLAGTGAFLAGARGKSKPELSWFLLTRGLWLVVLELTVVRFGMTFSFGLGFLPLLVFWSIGVSMIVLAGLVFLSTSLIAAFGIAMIAGHNLLDGIKPEALGAFGPVWAVLHVQRPITLPGNLVVFVAYPLIPWIGVMAAGYAFGELLLLKPERRRPVLLGLGLALTVAFVALRATNLYGDPGPWSTQKDNLFTLMSFLNCAKYPPSLLYLLMTLGPAIAALALFDREPGVLGRPLVTLGRVPLFFYVLQWPLIHGLAIVVALLAGHPVGWLFGGFGPGAPPQYGYGLPMVYLMWAVTILLLYPACRWFADVKRRRRDAWLSYL